MGGAFANKEWRNKIDAFKNDLNRSSQRGGQKIDMDTRSERAAGDRVLTEYLKGLKDRKTGDPMP